MKNLLPRKYLLPLLCLPFLFFSCKKELDEIEVDPVISWELHDQFLHYHRFISNLYSGANKLQVMGMHLFSTISPEGERENVEHFIHSFKNVSHHKYPMNSRIFTGVNGNYLHFKSVKDPVLSGVSLTIDVTKLDPLFREFSLTLSHSSESFALSENNVALVPYSYHNEETGRPGLRYFLVKLAIENEYLSSDRVVLKETRILTPSQEGGYVRHMRSHQNNFYVTTDWGFYKITEEGDVSFQMPDQIPFTSFEHKGDIYMIARHGRQQSHALFRSLAGQSWSMDVQLGNMAEMFNYHAISDKILLASYNSQIFELEIGVDTFSLKELDNAGLEGHYINSIAMVKDKVYIGTRSGLFSKSVEHLLTYKEEEKK